MNRKHFPFMSLNDGMEITHSQIISSEGVDSVYVYFEKWNSTREDFDSMYVRLPDGHVENVVGFEEEQIRNNLSLAKHYEPLFIKFAKQGGIGNRAEIV